MQVTAMKIPKSELIFTDDTEIKLQQNDEGVESFSMLAYSGKLIKGRAFWGGDLAIDVQGIQFESKRFPILEQHDLEKKIGVSNSRPATKDNQVVFDKINLLNNVDAQEFKSNLNDGFPYQASIGIRPLVIEELVEGTTAEVNGYKMKGPGTIIRKSTFREASVCVFGADPNTNVSLSENETFNVELVNGKEQKSTEETFMDLTELKENHPALFKQLVDEAVTEKDTRIQELTAQLTEIQQEKTELSEAMQKSEARMLKLEEAEAKRKAQDLKAQADSIMDAKLAEHKIPAEMHVKVHKQISHLDFVENDTFDESKFTEAVEAEVKDWAETLSKFAEKKEESVLGFGGNDREDFSEDVDDDVERLFKSVQG